MTVQIAIRLPDSLVAALDELVEEGRGPSTRTEGVRIALEAYLRAVRRQAIDEDLARGYAAHPIVAPDEWGDLEAQTDANVRRAIGALEGEDGGW